MNFLNEDDIFEGSIVPIYLNNRLEAYATLIENTGISRSFMEAENNESDGKIYVRQRWLVEWTNPDLIKEELPPKLRWTQKALMGNRTHRDIICFGGTSWEQYSYRHGGLREKNYYERGPGRSLDDSNLLF